MHGEFKAGNYFIQIGYKFVLSGWFKKVMKHIPNSKDIYHHYDDVIMGAIAFQITSLTIVYSIVYSDSDQRKHQSFDVIMCKYILSYIDVFYGYYSKWRAQIYVTALLVAYLSQGPDINIFVHFEIIFLTQCNYYLTMFLLSHRKYLAGE